MVEYNISSTSISPTISVTTSKGKGYLQTSIAFSDYQIMGEKITQESYSNPFDALVLVATSTNATMVYTTQTNPSPNMGEEDSIRISKKKEPKIDQVNVQKEGYS